MYVFNQLSRKNLIVHLDALISLLYLVTKTNMVKALVIKFSLASPIHCVEMHHAKSFNLRCRINDRKIFKQLLNVF